MVCKLIKPRRWDLIIFHPPEDPSTLYVKRLVGLPGEKLEIRDGAVWVDGKKLEPPESIAKIRYSATIEFLEGMTISGAGLTPIKLGPDECFVLGDNVDAAHDSRFWRTGFPDHPAYAVPSSQIEGVVINIYWPISRWTSFR
jgi:signal peptidase I